jgi:hypothetical protein
VQQQEAVTKAARAAARERRMRVMECGAGFFRETRKRRDYLDGAT